MHTHHSTLHHLHRIDFEPETFTPSDLLWLPHHAQLSQTGKKRQTEHLAGRIAAVYALAEYGEKTVPEIGEQRQPQWPKGLFGSISHCDTIALAVVDRLPIGVDIEKRFSPTLVIELAHQIVTTTEDTRLRKSGFSFDTALTLAFSAKESVFKAYSSYTRSIPGFDSAQVVDMTESTLLLKLNKAFSPELADVIVSIQWVERDGYLITWTQSCINDRAVG